MNQRWCAIGLRLVPIRIILWREMNIVRCRVAVRDVYILLHHHAENVRPIVTTVLIERYGR